MTTSAVIPDIAFTGSSGSGTLGPFSLIKSGTPIYFTANSQIKVYRYDTTTDTAPTLLVEGTDYDLTGGPNAGSITLTSPQTGLLTAERLYVYREQPTTQTLDLITGGNFSAANLEARLDRTTEMIQELRREVQSTVRFSLFDTDAIPGTLPLGAVIDKLFYISGTTSAPTLATIDSPANLLANIQLTADNIANINLVGSDLGGADTIGIVAADLDGDNTIGTVATNIADVNTVAGAIDGGSFSGNLAALAGLDGEDGDTLEWTGTDALQVVKKRFGTYAEMRAYTVAQAAQVATFTCTDRDGRTYVWQGGDKSTEVAADEITASSGNGRLWVAPTAAATGASGAWQASGGTFIFRDVDYINAAQIPYIRANDVASQTEATVTAGLQALFKDAVTKLFDDTTDDKTIIVKLNGTYAVNDEVFDEDTAQIIWDNTATGDASQEAGSFFVVRDGDLVAKNWPAATAVRTSGLWDAEGISDAVPMVIFRWEQQTKVGIRVILQDFTITGERDFATDPIGFKRINCNDWVTRNFVVYDCAQGGRFEEDINNGEGYSSEVRNCGTGLTESGGTGLISSSTTFAVSSGAATVTASANTFAPGDTGKTLFIENAGASGDSLSGVMTYVSATQVTLDRNASSTVTVSHGSYEAIRITTTATSASATLSETVSVSLAGRYVFIAGAGSSTHTSLDVQAVRITAHTAGTASVTLAAPARNSGTFLMALSVGWYIGKSDDQSITTGNNNDWQEYGARIENSFNTDLVTSIPLIASNCLNVTFSDLKCHATTDEYNNFAIAACSLIADHCRGFDLPRLQCDHGGHSRRWGKIMVFGERTGLSMPEASLLTDFEGDSTAIFYVSPKNSGVSNCKIGYSSPNLNRSGFPTTNQVRARYGANGTSRMLKALGPTWVRNSEDTAMMGDADFENVWVNGTLNGETFYFDKGTFNPTPTFATPGDLSLTYNTRSGVYVRIGNLCWFRIALSFDTNAYTTASGNFRVGSLPFASVASGLTPVNISRLEKITDPASTVDISAAILNAADYIQFYAHRSGTTAAVLGTGAVPASTTTVRFEATGWYEVAA